jgi:hypothetical protein
MVTAGIQGEQLNSIKQLKLASSLTVFSVKNFDAKMHCFITVLFVFTVLYCLYYSKMLT